MLLVLYHSEIVVHGLKSTAQEFASFWVDNLSDTASVLCVPNTQCAVF